MARSSSFLALPNHPRKRTSILEELLPAGAQKNDSDSFSEGQFVALPGALLKIAVDGDFQSPVFLVECEQVCHATLATLSTKADSYVSGVGIRYRTAPDQNNPDAFLIKFTIPSGTLEAGQWILLRLRSHAFGQVKVKSVTSITE